MLASIHSHVLSSPKGIELLDRALTRLLSHHDAQLIIIETSGSCHPLPLVELLWNQSVGGISLGIVGSWRAGIVADENHGISAMEIRLLKEQLAEAPGRFGERRCNLTVIGDATHVDRFADALTSCFLTDDEIARWHAGHGFDDPWPKNIVNMVS